MAVRPFYIEADIEGRKTPLAGGTARKNGEHHISIHQRDKGEITTSRLEESVKKILHAKYALGLTSFKKIPLENLDYDLNNENHQSLVRKLYAHSLTLLKNEGNLLPLQKDQKYYYLGLEEN